VQNEFVKNFQNVSSVKDLLRKTNLSERK